MQRPLNKKFFPGLSTSTWQNTETTFSMSRPAGSAPSVSGINKQSNSIVRQTIKQYRKTNTTNTSNLTNLLLRPRIEHKNRCLSEEEKGSHRGNLYKCCHCAASKLSAKKFFTHLENHVSAFKDNQEALSDNFSSGC